MVDVSFGINRRRRRAAGGGGPVTLSLLSLSASTVTENTAPGVTVGAILGTTAGSTLTLTDDAGGRFALSGSNVITGLVASSVGTYSITIREALAGATNTPRDTVLSVTAGGWVATVLAIQSGAIPTGRTSVAALKVPGVASLETGMSYDVPSKTVTLSGAVGTVSDWDFRNCRIVIGNSAVVQRITQCLLGETTGNGFVHYLTGNTAPARVRQLDYCTFQGPGNQNGAGTAINCALFGTDPSATALEIDLIEYNRFIDLTGDHIKAAGSNHRNGQIIRRNFHRWPLNLSTVPVLWTASTTFAIGDIALTPVGVVPENLYAALTANTGAALPSGNTSNSDWQWVDPHVDFITVPASVGNGVSIYENYFDFRLPPAPFAGRGTGLTQATRVVRNTGTTTPMNRVLWERNMLPDSGGPSAALLCVAGATPFAAPTIFREARIGKSTGGLYFNAASDSVSHWVDMRDINTLALTSPPSGASTVDIAAAPANTVAPAVTGSLLTGATLTTSLGTWTGWPFVERSIQWQRSANGTTGWSNISGAVDETYVLTVPDNGQYLRTVVTGRNSQGTATVNSAAVGPVVASYVMRRYDSGTARVSGTPGGTANRFEFSCWARFDALGTTPRLLNASQGINIQAGNNGVMAIQIWDSTGAQVYGATTGTGVASTSVEQHYWVGADWSTGSPTVELRVNGAVVTLTPTVGPNVGSGSLRPNRGHAILHVATTPADLFFGDLWFAYTSAALLGFATFYNGGAPPNLASVGSPNAWLGGPLTAAQLNAGQNNGSMTITVTATGFTDI